MTVEITDAARTMCAALAGSEWDDMPNTPPNKPEDWEAYFATLFYPVSKQEMADRMIVALDALWIGDAPKYHDGREWLVQVGEMVPQHFPVGSCVVARNTGDAIGWYSHGKMQLHVSRVLSLPLPQGDVS